MTLVLAKRIGGTVAIAADQRITRSGRVWDAHSSKLLVLSGYDGCLVLGYTGLAYIDRQPTDQWIAKELIDYFHPGKFHSSAMAMGLNGHISVARALNHLSPVLYEKIRGNVPFSLSVCGIKLRKRRAYPILDTWDNQNLKTNVTRMPKISPYHSNLLAIGDTGDFSKLRDRFFHSIPNDGNHLLNTISGLIGTILWRSAQTKTVGDAVHVVCVNGDHVVTGLWPGPNWKSPRPRAGEFTEQPFGNYSPWIIGERNFLPPMLSSGAISMNIGPWPLLIESLIEKIPGTYQDGMVVATRRR